MDLNALFFHEKNIDPKTVMVLRNRPEERELRKVLPWLAGGRHDLFNAYQQNHGDKVQNALTKPSIWLRSSPIDAADVIRLEATVKGAAAHTGTFWAQ